MTKPIIITSTIISPIIIYYLGYYSEKIIYHLCK